MGKGWLMRWLVSITFTGVLKSVCKCVDGGFPDVEPILNGLLTELPGIESSRILGGLAPHEAASKCPGDQADGLQHACADVFDVHGFAGDAGMHKKKVYHQMVAPCAPYHCAAETGGEPVGGDFEVEAEFALRRVVGQLLELCMAERGGLGIAVMLPALGGEEGILAGVGGASLHGLVVFEFARNPPARSGHHVTIVSKAEGHVPRLVVV